MSAHVIPSSPGIGVGPDWDGLIASHRQMLQTGQCSYIGRVMCIVVDPERRGALPPAFVTGNMGVRLDFFGEGNWPAIYQGRDAQTLLLTPFTRASDGQPGLPDIPDPRWKPPTPTSAQVQDRNWQPPSAPLIRQPVAERSRMRIPFHGGAFLACGPIAQILVKPKDIAGGWIYQCSADPTNGRSMELLVDENTGEAFLLFGKYVIRRYQ